MNEDHISLKLAPEKEKDESEEKDFTMYVMDISYFSGKLECYFNFQVVSPLDSIAASLFVLNWLS